jgi:hypothetical protein
MQRIELTLKLYCFFKDVNAVYCGAYSGDRVVSGKNCPRDASTKRYIAQAVLRIRIQDPVLFDPWIRDRKNPDPSSGMNIPDNFSENLERVFRVKNT